MEVLSTRGHVLAVDDDPSAIKLIKNKLCREGLSCCTAQSGEEAVEWLGRESFDIIVADLNMPGMSGLELLEFAHQKYARTAFVIVTGVDDVTVGIGAMRQGADDYLVKPFRLEALAASVERALAKKRLEIEVENYRKSLEEMVKQRTTQLQSALKRVELSYDETLETLGAALDLRDNETGGHSRRVSLYTLEIARVCGLSTEQRKQIARGSYLHDIGKIGIPDSILLKPGKLTADERAVMESHARIGYELVNRIAFLAGAAEIVLTHQERFDGTGYPQGLVGEEIPIGARIFAVADTLDAMTSDRPYRRALSFDAAKDEILRESGRQFDPDIVKVFLSISSYVWQGIRQRAAGMRLMDSAPTECVPVGQKAA